MDLVTIELISNASLPLFPNNTLTSFTKFLPEKVNLEGKWKVTSDNFADFLSIKVPERYRGQSYVFWREILQNNRALLS